MQKRYWILPLLPLLVLAVAYACFSRPFTAAERTIIRKSATPMYVTVLPEDSTLLRTPSRDFSRRELRSGALKELAEKMYRTVTDPSQDGVGIAAPQVGLNRRLIWVQRLDKPGEPWECFANIHIDALGGEVSVGPEGCLSVPGMRGSVPRHATVDISYVDIDSGASRQEHVEGFTAVIFQHEIDHLEGILYIDKADSVYVDEAWVQERAAHTYLRPRWWPY